MSYLRYLYLFVHSGVQHMVCCVFASFPRMSICDYRSVLSGAYLRNS
jgi:hypothetical protein